MTSAEDVQELLSSVEVDEERFVTLLTKLIDNVETLQNNPSQVRGDDLLFCIFPFSLITCRIDSKLIRCPLPSSLNGMPHILLYMLRRTLHLSGLACMPIYRVSAVDPNDMLQDFNFAGDDPCGCDDLSMQHGDT